LDRDRKLKGENNYTKRLIDKEKVDTERRMLEGQKHERNME
jgi:hypothetical protein